MPTINILYWLFIISTYKTYILHEHILPNPQYLNLTNTLLTINKQQIKSLLRQKS